MVEQKPVDVNLLTVLQFVPIIGAWTFYRIEKLRMYIVIEFALAVPSIVLQIVLPFPYYLIGTLPIGFGVPIYLIRKWGKKWNAKFSNLEEY